VQNLFLFFELALKLRDIDLMHGHTPLDRQARGDTRRVSRDHILRLHANRGTARLRRKRIPRQVRRSPFVVPCR